MYTILYYILIHMREQEQEHEKDRQQFAVSTFIYMAFESHVDLLIFSTSPDSRI